ncbi:MAG: glycoside hydrolase family 127 protein [Kiritimatiellae bacterium]|nr:glycoside hydrolase family 127 protein [Kiritimatiellia bacterium]
MKTTFLLVAVAAVSACAASPFADSLDNIGGVRLKGPLGERLDRMIAGHVLGTDVDYIVAPFREKTERRRCWQTEFWGKYMHSAVPYARYAASPALDDAIERGVESLLATQEDDGYIGNYPDELRFGEGWDVWGIKYTLMGLLHYYDGARAAGRTEKAARALDAAKRLCDCVIAEIGPNGKRGRELWETGCWAGYASSSILEPVVWLYRRTDEKKYLDFAAYIVKGMTASSGKGPRLVDFAQRGVSVADRNEPSGGETAGWAHTLKYGRSKAYEMMSCYQGMLEYWEVTKESPELFDAAVKTAEDIVREEINLAGGCACSEEWFHGRHKQHLPYLRLQETCVTTTWMRFCEKLLALTGEAKWAEEIEKTFYNAYLAALKRDGTEFAAYTPLNGGRWYGQHHCLMHTSCCTANGPRGFLCFLRELYRSDGKTATFNFYASARVDGFDVYTLYPRDGRVRITSHTKGPLKLRLRIPSWGEKTTVTLNDGVTVAAKPGTYFEIDREWALGDFISLDIDMPVVAHKLDHAVAFTRGPILLARDSRFADGDLSEPIRRGIRDGAKMEGFQSVRTPSDDIWMTFSAVLPLGPHEWNPEGAHPAPVMFCDYASAGNEWRPGNYYRTWFPEEYGPSE